MPLYLSEPVSPAAQAALTCDFGQLVTSVLTLVELRSALARHERTGILSREQATHIFERVSNDLSRTPRRLELSQDVLSEAVRLLGGHRESTRTLDVLHVATCLRYGTRGFVTNDKQQAYFAQAAGLTVDWLGGSLEL